MTHRPVVAALGAFAVALPLAFGTLVPVQAQGIEAASDEKARLKACEEQLCRVAIAPTSADATPLACSLTKTWQKSSIVDGVREKKVSWTFGDARCDLDVSMSRDAFAKALSSPSHDVVFEPHKVSCKIERESEITDVAITLAPKISFKDGKAHKAYLNVSTVEAPTIIKGAIWTVSQIEDRVGLFHGEIIEQINKFLFEKCPQRYSSN
ncbi:MAG: hypothetical protein ACFCUN_06840 [Hyphomicrobiaceae bacterium]